MREDTVQLYIRDRWYPGYNAWSVNIRFRQVEFKGKRFEFEGGYLYLFKEKVFRLATGLPNKTYNIWKWKKIIPPALFYTGEKAGEYYSSVQILNVHRVFHNRYNGILAKQAALLLESYQREIRKAFYTNELIEPDFPEGTFTHIGVNIYERRRIRLQRPPKVSMLSHANTRGGGTPEVQCNPTDPI